ncbi:MAG: PKD domain-containing protein, partial [Planctomycetes bacterium]|nr:PKD domain-containing protein [Planctomycetota bacterium]
MSAGRRARVAGSARRGLWPRVGALASATSFCAVVELVRRPRTTARSPTREISMRSVLVAAVLTAAVSAQATFVIPAPAATADGNTLTSYPFDIAGGRYLYVYDSSHFTGAGITTPILITQIRWRANASSATTWTGSPATVQMDLSTAPIDHLAISTTWNSNHGTDRLTVFNGPIAIAAGTTAAGVPGPFHAGIALATPFLYDPNAGDLTIDTIHTGLASANTPSLDAVTTAGVAKSRRVFSTTTPAAATATATAGELANVLEFTYVPAGGLIANFDANVTGGASPLAVNFSNLSFSSAPGGITSYAWDFDNDGVVDSTAQNPSWTYGTCGSYTVRLTVTDAVNQPATVTRTNFINTDRITANFSTQVVALQTVQFTDTSNMPAMSWAWDLDGD